MIPKIELYKIALAHARSGATRPMRGKIHQIRSGYETCLIGRFVPASSYFSFEKIESMITYEMRDIGIFDEEEMRFLNELDKINILDDDQWIDALEETIEGLYEQEG